MSEPWPKVRLGEVLTQNREYVTELEPRVYPKLTVKLYGRGVYLDTPADGASVLMNRHQFAKPGQVILSEIWAKKGAIGLVPDVGAGALVTSHFFLFDVHCERVLREYIDWLLRANYFEAQLSPEARGTTGYAAIRPSQFLSCEIPLPPLVEQRRIVARIEEVAARIGEARHLSDEAVGDTEALHSSHLGSKFAKLASHLDVVPLGNLTSHILDGPHQTPDYLPEGVPGVPFVTVKNMVTGRLDLKNVNYISREDHEQFSKRCRAVRGDILYSKDGATRGQPCLVDTDEPFSYFVSVALIKPLRDRLDSWYLLHLLKSSWIKNLMGNRSRGDMIPHIVLREIREFPVPLPPLPEQRRIAEELDAVQAKVDMLKRLQTESAADLDSLLPAVLDRAFKGEL